MGQRLAETALVSRRSTLFQAKNEGYIADVLTAPLRAWQLVVAYMAGALVRAVVATAVIAVAAATVRRRRGCAHCARASRWS